MEELRNAILAINARLLCQVLGDSRHTDADDPRLHKRFCNVQLDGPEAESVKLPESCCAGASAALVVCQGLQ